MHWLSKVLKMLRKCMRCVAGRSKKSYLELIENNGYDNITI